MTETFRNISNEYLNNDDYDKEDENGIAAENSMDDMRRDDNLRASGNDLPLDIQK